MAAKPRPAIHFLAIIKMDPESDIAVQKTASDAMITKIEAAKAGYFKDDYAALFCEETRHMMPIINRGTWTRVFAIRQLIENFISGVPEGD